MEECTLIAYRTEADCIHRSFAIGREATVVEMDAHPFLRCL